MSQKGRRARSEISATVRLQRCSAPGVDGAGRHTSLAALRPRSASQLLPRLAHPTTSVARMRCGTAANACPTCPLTTRTMAPLPLVWPQCTAPCWAIAVRRTFTPIHEPSALTSDPHRPGRWTQGQSRLCGPEQLGQLHLHVPRVKKTYGMQCYSSTQV